MDGIKAYGKGSKGEGVKVTGISLLTVGNRKMSIPMFSLPAEKTCPGSTELCRKYCYAKRAERLFPAVSNKRERNLKISKTPEFINIMVAEIEKLPLMPYVRIHDSGDFYSQDYLNKWIEIAKRFPKKKFLAFTKAYRLDFSKKPKNLIIYNSVWNDTKEIIKGKLNKAYTVMTYKSYTGVNIKIDKAEQCKGHCDSCLMCFENRGNVFFNIH